MESYYQVHRQDNWGHLHYHAGGVKIDTDSHLDPEQWFEFPDGTHHLLRVVVGSHTENVYDHGHTTTVTSNTYSVIRLIDGLPVRIDITDLKIKLPLRRKS